MKIASSDRKTGTNCVDVIYNHVGLLSLPFASNLNTSYDQISEQVAFNVDLTWSPSNNIYDRYRDDCNSFPGQCTEQIVQIRQTTDRNSCFRLIKHEWKNLNLELDQSEIVGVFNPNGRQTIPVKTNTVNLNYEDIFRVLTDTVVSDSKNDQGNAITNCNAEGLIKTCCVTEEINFDFRVITVKGTEKSYSAIYQNVKLKRDNQNNDLSIALGIIVPTIAILLALLIYLFHKNRIRRLTDIAIKIIQRWNDNRLRPVFVGYERVDLVRQLGKGAFGEVHEANISPKKRFQRFYNAGNVQQVFLL